MWGFLKGASSDKVKTLFNLVVAGDVSGVAALLEENPKLADAKDSCLAKEVRSGNRPLHVANEDIARLLLDHGARVDSRNDDGATPLHRASSSGEAGLARLLLSRGANVELRNRWGQTPLYIAVLAGNVEIVELLVSNGADIEAKNDLGNTLLHEAASKGYIDRIEVLLDNGADINSRDKNGKTPIHLATMEHHERAVRLLLDRGADVNSRDNTAWTPLHYAVLVKGHYAEIVELLVERGADVDAAHPDGSTPLCTATGNEDLPIMRLLLDHGASVEPINTAVVRDAVDMFTVDRDNTIPLSIYMGTEARELLASYQKRSADLRKLWSILQSDKPTLVFYQRGSPKMEQWQLLPLEPLRSMFISLGVDYLERITLMPVDANQVEDLPTQLGMSSWLTPCFILIQGGKVLGCYGGELEAMQRDEPLRASRESANLEALLRQQLDECAAAFEGRQRSSQ